jgi:serine/threonine protein kinase/Tol biopolymer transport system component
MTPYTRAIFFIFRIASATRRARWRSPRVEARPIIALPMALSSGTRIGGYEVVALLGEGGMGQVYRARDTRLNRDVALKVLPELFLHDPERLARFEREAQLLASLNHPNIAHIYEAGKQNAAFLALELVPGPTLAERLAGGPLGLEETLAIARQIVDALEAAHEHGVIHRDLKPANIKVREDGTVKVLDFGLAKALAPQGASGADALNSPTMSARATEMGVILGTAAYMSPEQAKGKPADKRADVWAFGVVLFEMIAGRQVFTGETASEVMASVLKEEPDWSLLPASLPPALRRLLRRCLDKDPRKRPSTMSDVRLELSEKDAATADTQVAPGRRSPVGLIGAALAGAALTAIGFLIVAPSLRSTQDRPPSRVTLLGPEGVTLFFDAAESAISPDGRTAVFTATDPTGTTRLWTRTLDSLDARPLAGTENGRMAFWSPDSRQIGFFAGEKLKKLPAGGGTVEVLCAAPDGRGASWGSQNVIVFSPSNAGPLQSVSANGGEPKSATTLDAGRGETGHRFPSFLPDGRHFMFAALPQKNLQFELFVASLDDPSRVPLGSAEGAAVYADPGYAVFARKGALFAQPLNLSSYQLSGEAVAIGDAPGATGGQWSGGHAVSASSTGTLMHLGDRLPNTRLAWLDRTGREIGSVSVPEGRYQELAIAPDGSRAAIVRYSSQNQSDIYLADLARGGATRFTTEQALTISVVWAADSLRILYSADAAGPRDLFVKPASGAVPAKPVYASSAMFKDSRAWSPDGKVALFEELNPKTNRDIWILPMDGSKPTLYLQTPYAESYPTFSPDGKWVAYASDESGRNEIYVDAFPAPRNKYRISDNGGISSSWRKDGKELLFVSADYRTISVADVTIGATGVSATPPRKLFDLPRTAVFGTPTRDHQRMLVARSETDNSTSQLTLVLDWPSLLRKN